jgi:hypothetical protein
MPKMNTVRRKLINAPVEKVYEGTTMYTMHRNKEISIKKGYHPFETYGNSPKDTDPKNLITYINFALK